MYNRWRVMDFRFKEETPFALLPEGYQFYVAIIGGDSVLEELFSFTTNKVEKRCVGQGTEDFYHTLWQELQKYGRDGLQIIWQPVIPPPTVPENYRLLHPYRCMVNMQDDGWREKLPQECEDACHEDDGYCMAEIATAKKCPYAVKSFEISY